MTSIITWRGAAIPVECPYPRLGVEGAPWAYNVDPGAGSAVDRMQRHWPDASQIVDLRLRDGRITPLFPGRAD